MRLMAKRAKERKIFDCENDGSALEDFKDMLAVDLNPNLGFKRSPSATQVSFVCCLWPRC